MRILTRLPFIRRLARALGSRLFHWAENNGVSNLNRNGEAWFIDALLRNRAADPIALKAPCLIIDVGANCGDFTATVLAVSRYLTLHVEIHAVDPAQYCVDRLHQRFSEDANVKIVHAGIGERTGVMHLYSPEPGSTLASLVKRNQLTESAGENVPVIRLDEYFEQAGCDRVSFLKLDVEGFEMAALRGLGERLKPELIEVIQFEYGGTTLDAGCTLRGFFELLESRGYAVAKLMPQALQVRGYLPWMENFAYANYIALPQSWLQRTSII